MDTYNADTEMARISVEQSRRVMEEMDKAIKLGRKPWPGQYWYWRVYDS